jgi:hypothetical protein
MIFFATAEVSFAFFLRSGFSAITLPRTAPIVAFPENCTAFCNAYFLMTVSVSTVDSMDWYL